MLAIKEEKYYQGMNWIFVLLHIENLIKCKLPYLIK